MGREHLQRIMAERYLWAWRRKVLPAVRKEVKKGTKCVEEYIQLLCTCMKR